jgi:coenzyme F420 biosynthesis associated uncharacterized protein
MARPSLVGGIALGIAASLVWVATRPHRGPVPELIDWARVRAIAARSVVRGDSHLGAGLLWRGREEALARYEEMVSQSADAISRYVGMTLPAQSTRTHVFDRVDWIDANVEAFRLLFEPMERLNRRLMAGGSVATVAFSRAGSAAVSGQMGMLIGYLAKRVLGQYDLALLGKEPITAGRLYFVEPNIASLQRQLGLHPREFRLWISLHETTHAIQFECNPWLRDYMNGVLASYFDSVSDDLNGLRARDGRRREFAERFAVNVRQRKSLIESVMTGEQRAVFDRLQALMCVVEGYSNHVMNQVGSRLLASYPTMKARFEDRLQHKGRGERLLARVTGLDVKLEQYQAGERFVDHVVARGGIALANRVWTSAWHLPSLREVYHPDDWIARVSTQPIPGSGSEPRDFGAPSPPRGEGYGG